MSRIARAVVVIALLPLTVTCGQRSPAGGAATREGAHAAEIPVAAARPASGTGIQQTLDDNDAMIAENKRIMALDNKYLATDPDKLGRLQKQCEKQVGVATDAPSARRIFACVEKSW